MESLGDAWRGGGGGAQEVTFDLPFRETLIIKKREHEHPSLQSSLTEEDHKRWWFSFVYLCTPKV
ncbi:hypothetical protein KP509_30G055400 [Ceratopteris richardii]|uniref:Uncharacterized protein n=1 Tax=Ceratopteris richardii TaxID=49495 RepID=A0A8T2R2I1_CERRI|nr:hypothetical protein KP509_30G055400 [Ceratopteris richardii]